MADPAEDLPPGFEALPGATTAQVAAADLPEGFEPLPSVEQQAADDNARLSTIFQHSELDKQGQDRRAGVLRLVKESGLPSGVVEAKYDDMRGSWAAAQFDPVKWRGANPELAKLVLEKPHLGTVVMRDQQMSTLTKALNWAHDAFLNGFIANEKLQADVYGEPAAAKENLAAFEKQDQLERQVRDQPRQQAFTEDNKSKLVKEGTVSRALVPVFRFLESKDQLDLQKEGFTLWSLKNAGADTYETEKRVLDMKRQVVRRDYDEGPAGQVASDLAEQIPGTADMLAKAGVGAVGVGLAAGGATLLATKSPAAARAAAFRAGSIAGKGSMALATFQQSTGQAYLDLLDMKDDAGNPIDEGVARVTAGLYGTFSAGTALATFAPIMKAMGPVGAAISQGSEQAALAAMVKDAGFMALAKRWASNWATSTATMGAQGLLNEAAKEVADYFAKSVSQGHLSPTSTIDSQALTAATGKSLEGGAAFAGAEVAIDGLTHALLKDRAAVANKQINAIHDASESPTVKADPEAAAQVVADVTSKGGEPVTAAHVDPHAFIAKAIEHGHEPFQLSAELLGETGPAQLRDALAQGGKLEVPMSDFMEKWTKHPVGQALKADTSTAHAIPTANEAAASEAPSRAQPAERAEGPYAADVEHQQGDMGLLPMFRSADEAGMSGPQWADYLAHQREAARHGARAAEFRAAQDVERQTSAWWKEQTAKEHAAALAEYDELPAVRAREAIGNGKPDDVAELFGFPTGEALTKAIEALPSKEQWSQKTAETRMLEQYSATAKDLVDLRATVAQGLHGPFTEKWLRTELDALAKRSHAMVWNPEANRMQAVPNTLLGRPLAPADVTKARAREIADQRPVNRLDAGTVQRQERAAADAALRAAVAGNHELAWAEKQTQLLNFHLWKELAAAREMRDKFMTLVSKLAKDDYRQRLGQGHPTYLGGADLILEHLGLKGAGPREAPLPSIGEVIDQLEADSQSVSFSEDVLGQVLAKPLNVKDLTVAQMRDVHAALLNIKAAARNRSTILIDGKRIAKADAVKQLQDEAGQHLPPKAPPPTRGAETPWQFLGGWFNAMDGEVRKPEFLLNRLGGRDTNSAWHRYTVDPVQQAKHAEADLFHKYGEPVIAALKKLGSNDPMQMIDGKGLFPTHTTEAAPPQRRFELLVMLLNAGNEQNLQRLTEGRGITEQQIRDAAAKVGITKDEYDAIQAVGDAFEPIGKLAFDLEERDSGIRPDKVQPRAFDTPHGRYPGFYYPLIYSADVTNVGARQAAQLMDTVGFTRPGTQKGHLKSRVEGFADIVSLEPSAISRHVAQALHDLAYRERLRATANLLLDDDVQSTMRKYLGAGKVQPIPQWLRDVGQMRGAEQTRAPRIAAVMQWAKGNLHAVLGYSAANALEDYGTTVSTACVGSGLKVQHLGAALLEVKGYDMSKMSTLESMSGELRFRRDHIRKELLKQQSALVERNIPGRGLLRFYKDHAQVLSEVADRTGAATVWLAAFRQYHAEHTATEHVETEATRFADAMVRKVLPSHSPVDQSPLMRDKGAVGAFLIMHGWFNHAANRLLDITDQAGESKTIAGKVRMYGAALGFMTAVTVLSGIVRGQGPGEGDEPDDEEDPTKRRALKLRNYAARKLLVGTAELHPLTATVGQLGEAVYLGKNNTGVRNNSIAGIMEQVGKGWLQAMNEDREPDARVKALLRTFEPVVGVPTSQAVKTGGYVYDWASGNVDVRGPGDVAGGLVYGQGQNPPSNVPTMIQDAVSGE